MVRSTFLQIICALFLLPGALFAQQNCPLLRVSLATDGWVACDNAVCRIRVCNEGSQPATNARVEVTLPAALDYISSSLPAGVFGSRVVFNLGTFAAGNCLDFSLTLAVDCNLAPGEALCLKAHATPALCPAAVPGWDGSDLVVRGACYAPDSVSFSVLNQGLAPMSVSTNYIIIEDHLMLQQGIVPALPAGDSVIISIPSPTGKTYTFQTSQTPGHPFPQPISVSVEGCGAPPASTGYLLQYPQHNGEVYGDTYCDVVSAGIGGIDKDGFPLGYGTEHRISRTTELTYRLRFQNTGNATVQTVTLVDTLSEWLDLSTFRSGAASHLYTWSIQNQVLTVVFPSAQLPPSSVNEPASRGFFTFHIGVLPSAPENAVIENTARVKLGNQTPVQTDTTVHRLSENFIALHLEENSPGNWFPVLILPNPMGESAQVVFPDAVAGSPVWFQLFDGAGRLVREAEITEGRFILERGDLAEGFYFFRCWARQGGAVGGKLGVGRF